MTLTINTPDAILTKPVAGTGCAQCAEYERRIEVLEQQLAAWEEWGGGSPALRHPQPDPAGHRHEAGALRVAARAQWLVDHLLQVPVTV